MQVSDILNLLLNGIGTKNAKDEYYFTEIVEIANRAGRKCSVVEASEIEAYGINSRDELAQAEGIKTSSYELLLMLLIAAVIALTMKIVGVLLVTSLLIIPAAAARSLSRTPEQMALMSALIGILSVLIGLASSFQFDTPSGPSIVLAAVLLFILGQIPLSGRI